MSGITRQTQVALTRRADKLQKSGTIKTFKRWFFALGAEPGQERAKASDQLARSPIVLAAVDVDNAATELLEKLRDVLAGTPPPWLRKVMFKGESRQFDFDDEVQHD